MKFYQYKYISLYILLGVKLTLICECLNLMTMHVCILSFIIIIIIIIFFGVTIGFLSSCDFN